ncbi:MAG: ABC transporter ATP-binding protein [Gammaproteobacteria bacterium]|nr:ABC transporter ATP-binding protein [Gammaproteobacteria bacterium]
MTTLVVAKGLGKHYGRKVAVDGVSFQIEAGRIVGLIGPNGAGKSSTLKALLGLTRHQGELRVLGRDPRRDRAKIMQEVSYIADIASLPSWILVADLLDFVDATHPAFERRKALAFLDRTDISPQHRVKQLSKGMKTQLHLALVMGINARLLILDEPTLGLDIIYRKEFYSQLLNEYFDEERTILLTTHQIEEVEHILTDLMFINAGRLMLDMPVEDIGSHFVQLRVRRDRVGDARQLDPLYETQQLTDSLMIFRDADVGRLQLLGEVRPPKLADLFVACVKGGLNE